MKLADRLMLTWRAKLAQLLVLLNALIVLGRMLDVVSWSDAQVLLVMTATSTTVTLIVAVLAHVWRSTTSEPVAVGATIGAFVPSVLLLLNGFGVTELSEATIEAVIGVVVAAGALFGITITRSKVAPIGPNVDPDYVNAAIPTDRGLPPGQQLDA